MSGHLLRPFPCRRFGRTGIEMPLLSLGGMRFQQSWKELSKMDIENGNQKNVEEILKQAVSIGLHHVETARHYGSSEMQLGWAFENVFDRKRLLQTKIPPHEDPNVFEAELAMSFKELGCSRLDLLAIHGLNLPEHLEQTIRPGGCLDVVRRWQHLGRIGSVGFSTHGPTQLIVDAIQTNEFDYVNLHWYFIRQDNAPALEAARKFDLGVFIISPTDKGGHLHTPSQKLIELCWPLHPIVFNDLFCLRDTRVHTISVGAAKPQDINLHLQAIALLHRSNELLPLVEKRLSEAASASLGEEWMKTWNVGLPSWNETPGHMNIPILLWLHNLIEAWDMEGYSKARYGLLGNGSHWFPGRNADSLDDEVSEESLKKVLINSPWINEIPRVLRNLRIKLAGNSQARLSNS